MTGLLFVGMLVGGPMFAALAALDVSSARAEPAKPGAVDFGRDIAPLLQERCLQCHAGRNSDAGLALDIRSELLGESNGEPLVVPGQSATSRLVARVSESDANRRMPPADAGPPLTAGQIDLLKRWIDQGLPWDDNIFPPSGAASEHWAFRPVPRVTVPDSTSPVRAGAATSVDLFLITAQQTRGIRANGVAPKQTQLRRLALDLIGLPPAQESLEEFLADEEPDAWHRQVDRLLASPRHGERWGRHWLDVARWAESEGFESNHVRPYAWRYRDYVVRAFNDDRPYDRFLREQIAGDELEPLTDESLIATGFLAGARLSSNEEDKALQRNTVLVDIVNMVGEGVLGITFGCAQCHNHKFDPLTQRDYYSLQAFFVKGQPANLVLRDPELSARYEKVKPAEYDPAVALSRAIYERYRSRLLQERLSRLVPEWRAALAVPIERRSALEHELARQADLELQLLTAQVEKEIAGDDKTLYESLKKKIGAMEKNLPDRPQTWGYYSPATASNEVEVLPMKGFYPLAFDADELCRTPAFLLVRGDAHRRGAVVAPRVPEFLESPGYSLDETRERVSRSPSSFVAQAARSRSDLVDWLTDPRNPLTARVWVNRVWQYHFGQGIVETPNDFGVKGAAPTHPELLDFLASYCVESGWSTKAMHRLLVTSNVYRQSSEANDACTQADPENRLLWQWRRRRLESEAIRDVWLDVSGQLVHRAGGPSDSGADAACRSIYVLQKRDQPPEMQRLFDGPSANESCGRRNVSTVALQPLFLLNSPFSVAQSRRLAARVQVEAGDEAPNQVNWVYRLALGRAPSDRERDLAMRFLQDTSEPQTDARWSTLQLLCQTLLNLNEAVYIE